MQPQINDLVRDGRATARDGALLLALRRDIKRRHERKSLRKNHPWLSMGVGVMMFFLALIGIRHEA